jgi:preprotein translocase subunit SecD
MTRLLRVQFLAVVLLSLLALAVVAPFPGKSRVPVLSSFGIKRGMDLAGGAELRYTMLFPAEFHGNREEVTRMTADVLRRRLESKLLQEPKVYPHGSGDIVVQLPGVDAEGLEDCKRLLRKSGQLRLHATAPVELQERSQRDGVIPDGYSRVLDRHGVSYLIETTPVIEGSHILDAEPRPDIASGAIHWVTTFDLNAEGAKRFDDAAERLYHRTPRGRLVIILDGEVQSAPVVNSPAFHGRGQITSSRE